MEQVPGASFNSPGRNPEHPRRPDGINGLSSPPSLFVTKAMVVPVMGPAQRYGEFVADLAPHRAGLSEAQMVRVCGASPTNQTRLRRHELEMRFIAMPTRLADRELAFLDFGGSSLGLQRCRSRRIVIDGWFRRDRGRSR